MRRSYIFDDRLLWQHKLGLIFFASGLALSLFIVGYMNYYESYIGEIENESFIVFLSLLITGTILIIVGINYLIIGFIESYRMEKEELPESPIMGFVPHKNIIPTGVIICKGCQRQIPCDSNLCPYCGMSQIGKSSITLKDI